MRLNTFSFLLIILTISSCGAPNSKNKKSKSDFEFTGVSYICSQDDVTYELLDSEDTAAVCIEARNTTEHKVNEEKFVESCNLRTLRGQKYNYNVKRGTCPTTNAVGKCSKMNNENLPVFAYFYPKGNETEAKKVCEVVLKGIWKQF